MREKNKMTGDEVQYPEEKKWSPSMPHVSAVKNNYILIGILKIDYF